MNKLWRVQVSLQDVSGLSADEYINTIYLANGPANRPAPVWADVATAVTDFYFQIKGYLSSTISGNLNWIRIYDTAAVKGSPPIFEQQMNLRGSGSNPGAGQTPMPNEVSCCLTYHAAHPPIVLPRQSWRGRIYIGPLNATAVSADASTGSSRPDPAFRANLVAAAIVLERKLANVVLAEWVIASNKHDYVMAIDNFSVDDAWDTQRRRGSAPTVKTMTDVDPSDHLGGSGPWQSPWVWS